MKKVILGTALFLAATSPALAEDYNWTGAYAGVHVGGAWGNTTVRDNAKDGVAPGPFSYDTSGAFGGGTAGYNYQIGNIVIGVEGDVGYLDLSGSGIIGSAHADHHQNITTSGGAYGDLTGRLGWAWNNVLFYGKGGILIFDGEALQATTADGYAPHGTDTFVGWTAGGGVEYAMTQKISLKIEYMHMDMGTRDGDQTALVADPPTPAGYAFTNSHDVTADSVKLGLNFHF